MSFKIEKPGFYRTRGGSKAYVGYIRYTGNDRYYAVGHFLEGDIPESWSSTGMYSAVESSNDLVSLWDAYTLDEIGVAINYVLNLDQGKGSKLNAPYAFELMLRKLASSEDD